MSQVQSISIYGKVLGFCSGLTLVHATQNGESDGTYRLKDKFMQGMRRCFRCEVGNFVHLRVKQVMEAKTECHYSIETKETSRLQMVYLKIVWCHKWTLDHIQHARWPPEKISSLEDTRLA